MRVHITTIVLTHQFELYALRDKLREAAINQEVNSRNWVFEYLDSSIAKTIDVLERITIWRIVFTPVVLRKQEKILRARMHLQRELSKPKNKCLASIHNEYTEILGLFVVDRHSLLKSVAIKCLQAFIISKHIRKQWRKGLELQTEAPETSTLLEYAPA
jgi:hypothetical protein